MTGAFAEPGDRGGQGGRGSEQGGGEGAKAKLYAKSAREEGGWTGRGSGESARGRREEPPRGRGTGAAAALLGAAMSGRAAAGSSVLAVLRPMAVPPLWELALPRPDARFRPDELTPLTTQIN